MTDILVRNVAEKLKKDVERQAQAAGRSISDEVKHLIELGLVHDEKSARSQTKQGLGDAMHEAFRDCRLSDAEVDAFNKAIDELRREPDRPLPDFE